MKHLKDKITEETAVFTITKVEVTNGNCATAFNIKSEKYNNYNKYSIHKDSLFESMEELTDTFNNIFGLSIVFKIK